MDLFEATLGTLPRLTRATRRDGLLLHGSGDRDALDIEFLLSLLHRHDLVVLRGFGFDAGSFDSFSKGLFQDVFNHHNRGRCRVPGSAGTDLLPADGTHRLPHVERGYAPAIPDLVAFFCERPADEGGLTTFHHGIDVYRLLRNSAKRFFSENRFRWKLHVRRGVWHRVLGVRSIEAVNATYTRQFRQYVQEDLGERVSYSFSGTDLLVEFVTPAVRLHPVNKSPMFINGSLAFLQDIYAGKAISGMLTLENGDPVPEHLLAEALESARACTVALALQSGDTAIANNHAVLHGRTAFADPGRRMLVQFGMRARRSAI
ncbi:MAG: TauD/TfdA family dioxygenase [Alphaproteobacteria bacterium]|nr:TauD/TfdA family dioxygenase [Alphaproteobacteria bacterium]